MQKLNLEMCLAVRLLAITVLLVTPTWLSLAPLDLQALQDKLESPALMHLPSPCSFAQGSQNTLADFQKLASALEATSMQSTQTSAASSPFSPPAVILLMR